MYPKPLQTLKLEFFAYIVKSIGERFILDVAGVSIYNDNHQPPLVTVRIFYPGDPKFLT